MKLRLALLILLFCGAASAKCIEYQYEIVGSTLSSKGEPISGVLVSASWVAWPESGFAQAISNQHGQFNLKVIFNPLSAEGAQGDECNGKLNVVSVKASREGYIEAAQEISPIKEKNKISIQLHQKHG